MYSDFEQSENNNSPSYSFILLRNGDHIHIACILDIQVYVDLEIFSFHLHDLTLF